MFCEELCNYGGLVCSIQQYVGSNGGSEEPQERWFHMGLTAVGDALLIYVVRRQSYSFQWDVKATPDRE